MSEDYTRDDLLNDIELMVKAGLIDIRIREDGEWLYSISDEAAGMTDDERMAVLDKYIAENE